MKQQDLLKLIDEYGIDLNRLAIIIGECSGWEGAHGVYKKDGQWVYYSADGRNHIEEEIMNSEDEAFNKMFRYMFLDLDTKRYLTKIIDEEIVKIEKKTVCQFIHNTFSLSEQQANNAWDYLKKDMHVLFEFKYYVVNGYFVPEKYCYNIEGYSAEKIYNETKLTPLGAYNYLIYLRDNPDEALANLKAGLPTK